MSTLGGASAVAAATFRDLRRRPGLLLAAIAVAVLLLLLPDICTRAVDESAALGLQVGLSTIGIFLVLAAGFAGLRAGAAEGDLGAAPEWRAAPLAPGAYVAGRFAGVLATATLLFAALAAFLVFAQIGLLRDEPPQAHVAAFAACAAIVAAAQFAAVGLLFATATSPQLAAVLFLATVVAGRTLVPEFASRGGALAVVAALFPDPARLDLSRELAFHRPVDGSACALALLAASLHAAACLIAASWTLRRRET